MIDQLFWPTRNAAPICAGANRSSHGRSKILMTFNRRRTDRQIMKYVIIAAAVFATLMAASIAKAADHQVQLRRRR
jgi:hypothetical protein